MPSTLLRVDPDEAMENVKGGSHGSIFSCMIHTVDGGAKDSLGLAAIGPFQYYRRCYTGGRVGDSVSSGTTIGQCWKV